MRTTRVSSRIAYESQWLTIRSDETRRGDVDGQYDVVVQPDSVIIVPVSKSGKTVMLYQFRYPTQGYGFEFPMGAVEDGESSIDAARRELFEETHLQVEEIKEIARFRAVPGLMTKTMVVFVAKVSSQSLHQASVTGVDDIVALNVFTTSYISELVERGEVTDGMTLATLGILSVLGIWPIHLTQTE